MILGIDYGKKRIGLAIAEEQTKVAMPYKIIENKGFSDFLSQLKEIIKNEQIEKIVIGVPQSLQGGSSDQTAEVLDFIEKLKSNIDIPIFVLDEKFTTKIAGKLLKDAGRKEKDAVAAMVILQDHLDKSQAPNPNDQ